MDPQNLNNFPYCFEDKTQQTSFSSQFPQHSSQYNPYPAGYPLPSFKPYLPSQHQVAILPTHLPGPSVVEVCQDSQSRRSRALQNTPTMCRPCWYPAEDLIL